MSDLELFAVLEAQWMAAACRRDRRSIESYLAPDFMSTTVGSDGVLMKRDEWLDYVCAATAQCSIHDVTVRRYGGAAVVNLILRFTGDWNSDFLITDLWIKFSDGWKVAHRHNSYPASAYTVNQ